MMSGNRFMRGLRMALMLSVLGAFGSGAAAATHYVSPWEKYPFWFMTPEMAAWEIQSAIDGAEEGDEVIVAPGYYRGNITIKKGVSLWGSEEGEVRIAGASPTGPVLTLTWDNTVRGLRIYGSRYDGSGIYAELGAPPAKTASFTPFRITDCTISYCAGSGILIFAKRELDMTWIPEWPENEWDLWKAYVEARYNTELQVEVSRCVVRECGGTGIAIHVEGDLNKRDVWFEDPMVPVEVGFKHGILKLQETTVSKCRGTGVSVEAGWNDRAQVIMDRCIVAENGGSGVSMHSEGATWNGAAAWVSNCLIAKNVGNGIFCLSYESLCWHGICPDVIPNWVETGEIYADSTTIVDNGVSVYGSLWLRNCIVWNNADPEPNPPYTPRRGAAMARNNCVQWPELEGSDGNIKEDPLFVDPESGDFRLGAGSPCIDAGGMFWKPTICAQNGVAVITCDPGTDLGGNPRISGNAPDMGAYEAPGEAVDYIFEYSDDLTDWRPGVWGTETSWADPGLGWCPRMFYRVGVRRHQP